MLTLYYKPYCFFCTEVLEANESIGAPLVLRNVSTDSEAQAEVLQIGGKRQTPFIVDDERGESLYESKDIIAYLETYYRKHPLPTEPASHISEQ